MENKTVAQIVQELLEKKAITAEEAVILLQGSIKQVQYVPYVSDPYVSDPYSPPFYPTVTFPRDGTGDPYTGDHCTVDSSAGNSSAIAYAEQSPDAIDLKTMKKTFWRN